jgi:hypothetical protein
MRGRKWSCCALAAEGHDHRCHHLQAEGQLHRRAGLGAFLLEDVLLHRRPAGAAVVFGPSDRTPSLRVQYLLPGDEIVFAHALAAEHLAADGLGQFGPKEGADVLAKGLRPLPDGACKFVGSVRWWL